MIATEIISKDHVTAINDDKTTVNKNKRLLIHLDNDEDGPTEPKVQKFVATLRECESEEVNSVLGQMMHGQNNN